MLVAVTMVLFAFTCVFEFWTSVLGYWYILGAVESKPVYHAEAKSK